MTPKERAQKSAETMWNNDQASSWFGMRIDEIDEGFGEADKRQCAGA